MTADVIEHGSVHGERIPLDDAIKAFNATSSPARKALYAFAIATRFSQDQDPAKAFKWARTAAELYDQLPDTIDVAADHPLTVLGVSMPSYLHGDVVRNRFKGAFRS
jgi:hypothetical protein